MKKLFGRGRDKKRTNESSSNPSDQTAKHDNNTIQSIRGIKHIKSRGSLALSKSSLSLRSNYSQSSLTLNDSKPNTTIDTQSPNFNNTNNNNNNDNVINYENDDDNFNNTTLNSHNDTIESVSEYSVFTDKTNAYTKNIQDLKLDSDKHSIVSDSHTSKYDHSHQQEQQKSYKSSRYSSINSKGIQYLNSSRASITTTESHPIHTSSARSITSQSLRPVSLSISSKRNNATNNNTNNQHQVNLNHISSLVDQNWDQTIFKTNWINKIDDDEESKLIRAELKGSQFLIFKPSADLTFAKNLIIDSPSLTNDNTSLKTSADEVTSLMNNEFIQSTSIDSRTIASSSREGVLDNDNIGELKVQLDKSSIFGSTIVSQANSPLLKNNNNFINSSSSLPIENNVQTNDNNGDNSLGVQHLQYECSTCPHPNLVFDYQSGMIIRGNLEAICHTVLFYPSDSLTDKLIEIIIINANLSSSLNFFIKYFDLFANEQNSQQIVISNLELELLLRRIRRVLDILESQFSGLLLNDNIFKLVEQLMKSLLTIQYVRTLAPPKVNQTEFSPYLPNNESNVDELNQRIHRRRLNLNNLIAFERGSSDNHDLSILSAEKFLEISNDTLLIEINAIDHFFFNNWNPHCDRSLLFPNDINKFNPLHFDPNLNSHYLGRLIAYHLFEDPQYSISPQLRAQILTKWIQLGQMLCDSGNMVSWLGIAIVICGLPILRLAETWGNVDQQLIVQVSKKWAPVVFEVRRSEIYDQSITNNCKILVPRGIGSLYAKEDVIPYYGDLSIHKFIDFENENLDVIKIYCGYLDKVFASLQKWDKYYNHIVNSESIESNFNSGNSQNKEVSSMLKSIIGFNVQNGPFSLQYFMDLSLNIELSYMGNSFECYSNARSPLFLGSYAPILFLDILPNYHIYDQLQLIGAIGGGGSESLLKIMGNKPNINDENHNLRDNFKRDRNVFLKHIRDTFNAGTIEFNMGDESIVFKTKIDEIKSQGPKSRPASVLFDSIGVGSNNKKNRVSVMSASSFNLNEYINSYNNYLRDSIDDPLDIKQHENTALEPTSTPVSEQVVTTSRIEVEIKAATVDRLIDLLVLTSSIFGTKIKPDDVKKYLELLGKDIPVVFQMDNGGFTKTFFSTYRVFYTTLELINALSLRFTGAKSAAVSITSSFDTNDIKFPHWKRDIDDDDNINWKFVAQIQLGVLEATLEFVSNFFQHFFDNLETKAAFDKFLEIIDLTVVNKWPEILKKLQESSTNKEYTDVLDIYNSLELVYKQLRTAFIRQSFTPYVGPISLTFTEEIRDLTSKLELKVPSYDTFDELLEYMNQMELTISSLLLSATPNDWVDCFGVMQSLISKSPLSLFDYDFQYEGVHNNLIHISNIYHWILTLKDGEMNVLNQLPIRIQSIFKFYEKVRDFFLMQITNIEINNDERIQLMKSLLTMVGICRIKMRNVKLFDDEMDRSPFIPSFLESVLTNTILLPSSRFYSNSWIKAAQFFHPEVVQFDNLGDMLPNLNDQFNNINIDNQLSVCPGWILNRILEIACFVPNMDVDNTNLINFDKTRFVNNSISKIYDLRNKSFNMNISPYETKFGVFFKLKSFDTNIKTIFDHAMLECDEGLIEPKILFNKLIKKQRYLIQIEQEKKSLLMKQENRKSNIETESKSNSIRSSNPYILTKSDMILPQQTERSKSHLNTQQADNKQQQRSSITSPSLSHTNKFKLGFLKSRPFSINISNYNVEKRSVEIDELPHLNNYKTDSKSKPSILIPLKNCRIFPTYRTLNSFTIGVGVKNVEYTFQCHNTEEVEDWIYKLTNSKNHWYKSKVWNKQYGTSKMTFGIPLEFLCIRDQSSVPLIIEKMMNEIEVRGLEEIGIYRKSASLSIVEQIKEIINKKGDLNMENSLVFDVHNITGCIKAFLRELPQPLIPDELIDEILKIKTFAREDIRFEMYVELLNKLPLCNYQLIERLTRHMKTIEEYKQYNKMTSYNLATIMGGSLVEGVKPDNMKKCFGLMNFICEDWLLNYDKVF